VKEHICDLSKLI